MYRHLCAARAHELMSFGESLRSAEARSRSESEFLLYRYRVPGTQYPMVPVPVLYPVPGTGKKTPGEPGPTVK